MSGYNSVAGYNDIVKFLKNIYYANGKRFDENFTTMLVREITATGAKVSDLQKAEVAIIRESVPLVVNKICDVIRENIELPKIEYTKVSCNYCNGKGYVIGLLFDFKGFYTGYRVALNCVCGNAHTPNMLMMKEDISNNHKTPCKDGYYRIFPSIVEEFAYIDKLEKNNWRDIR